MPYYDASVVSMSEGTKAVKGTSDVRASYNEAVKANPRDLTFQSGGVNFSDDGTMAWDYGTFSSTANDARVSPSNRPATSSTSGRRSAAIGAFVAEISNSAPCTAVDVRFEARNDNCNWNGAGPRRDSKSARLRPKAPSSAYLGDDAPMARRPSSRR